MEIFDGIKQPKNYVEDALNYIFTIDPNLNDHFKEEKYNHVIVFYSSDEEKITIYHLVGYQEHPNLRSLEYNIFELCTDDDFKLNDDILENLQYEIITL